MILIVGASGHLGRIVAQRLLAQGRPVRAMSRTPEKLRDLQAHGAAIVAGDLRDPASLDRACQDVEQVLAAAHGFPGDAGNNPWTVDDRGNRALVAAAKAAGVQHFVFTSVIGARPNSPFDFFRIKYRAEEYVRQSGLSFTILRASAFMDTWATLIGQPIIERGRTTIFGRGDNPVNFVAVDDLVHYALLSLDDPAARNQTLEVGGPENLTLNQVAAIFERVGGQAAKKRHIPLPIMRVMAKLVRPFRAGLSSPDQGWHLHGHDRPKL